MQQVLWLSENTLNSIMKKLLASELVESLHKVQNLDKIGISLMMCGSNGR
jgi:hypothetical protein